MKKILSLLLGVFIATFFWGALNILFAQGEVGVNLGGSCLTGIGQNCLHYEKIVGIDEAQGSGYTATSIAQDVVFAATYAVGTVLTIVIIWCGLGYIFSSASGNDKTKDYVKGLKFAAIGAILVWGAYAIVRLIQYIARG